jgi:hypothetical protein
MLGVSMMPMSMAGGRAILPVGRKGNLLAVRPRRSRPGEKHKQAAGGEKKTLHAGSSKIALRRMLFKREKGLLLLQITKCAALRSDQCRLV